ncbi:hypothetical protein VDS34_11200 [Xanthomonas campestris pv. campestris]|nr:hypothetical protein [Xanthomonas campestris pv. campestris]
MDLLKQVEQLKATSQAKLFPELSFDAKNGPVGRTQHALSRYLVNLGIKARGEKAGHHSFRAMVIGALKAAAGHREMREEYTGHELSGWPEHASAYEMEFSSSTLAEACHPQWIGRFSTHPLWKFR